MYVAIFVHLTVCKISLVGWLKWMDPLMRVTEVELCSLWSMRWHEAGEKYMLLCGTKPLHSCHFGMTAHWHFCQFSRLPFASSYLRTVWVSLVLNSELIYTSYSKTSLQWTSGDHPISVLYPKSVVSKLGYRRFTTMFCWLYADHGKWHAI